MASVMQPSALLQRLEQATNEHDLEALVDCFTADYRNETPAHPARGFRGSEQVRTNWRQIFAAVPDVHAEVLRSAVAGDELWSEWEMRGTRADGTEHHLRGVIVFGVTDGTAAWARFYLEAVEDATASAADVTAAVRQQVLR